MLMEEGVNPGGSLGSGRSPVNTEDGGGRDGEAGRDTSVATGEEEEEAKDECETLGEGRVKVELGADHDDDGEKAE